MNAPARTYDAISSLVYNPYYQPAASIGGNVDLLERLFPGYKELSKVQRAIFYEFVNQRKVIGSRSAAMDVILGEDRQKEWKWKQPGGKYQIIPANEGDVDMAYAVGAGGGCDFEWPYE